MLLPLLEERYEQIFVFSRNYDAEKYHGMVDRVHQLDMRQSLSPMRVVREVLRLRKIILTDQPDIVYSHSSFAGALGRLVCGVNKMLYIILMDGPSICRTNVVIEEGKDGLLVDVDSLKDVKAKVMYLYNHKEETEEMKEKAYQKALKRFDIHGVLALHNELFTEHVGVNPYIALVALFTCEEERRWAA